MANGSKGKWVRFRDRLINLEACRGIVLTEYKEDYGIWASDGSISGLTIAMGLNKNEARLLLDRIAEIVNAEKLDLDKGGK